LPELGVRPGILFRSLAPCDVGGQSDVSRSDSRSTPVKAFLRLIMLKMEVSSRSAIVAKVMMTQP